MGTKGLYPGINCPLGDRIQMHIYACMITDTVVWSGYIHRHAGIHRHTHIDRRTDTQTCRQTDTPTYIGRRTDTQTHRLTDSQTHANRD